MCKHFGGLLLKAAIASALSLVFAASAAVPRPVGPPYPYTHGAKADSIILAAADHAYNLQFDQAESLMVKLVDLYPTHPMGHFFWAMCYWGRYCSDFDDVESRDRYMELLSLSIDAGNEWLKEREATPEIYFYLGGAYGFRGMAHLLQGKWIGAYLDGRRGKNLLDKAVELEPKFIDAYLGVGLFHYYVATLPRYLKVLARLLLLGGDRQQGLSQIEYSAREGYYAVTQAKITLIDLYADFEDRPLEGMALLRECRARYPGNVWLLVNKDQLHIHLAEYDSSLAIEAALIDSCRLGARYFKPNWIPHFRFKMGVCHFRKGDYAAAEAIFRELADRKPEHPDWAYPWALIQLGMTLDVTGRKEEAREVYRRVLKLKDEQNSRRCAMFFLDLPYRAEFKDVYPNYFWNGAPLEGRYRP